MAKHLVTDPVVLSGRHVRLEPLRAQHAAELEDIALDPDLWRWTLTQLHTTADVERYVADALIAQEAGSALPFITRDAATGRAIGSTRFGAMDRGHRRVEIGWTWIAAPWQRTAANTEAKLLMLAHAFETWRCLRVELKTDALNVRSRAAIARLGAVEEGTLRQHMVTASGRVRDTVYFSVIDTEWPAVKARLQQRLRP